MKVLLPGDRGCDQYGEVRRNALWQRERLLMLPRAPSCETRPVHAANFSNRTARVLLPGLRHQHVSIPVRSRDDRRALAAPPDSDAGIAGRLQVLTQRIVAHAADIHESCGSCFVDSARRSASALCGQSGLRHPMPRGTHDAATASLRVLCRSRQRNSATSANLQPSSVLSRSRAVAHGRAVAAGDDHVQIVNGIGQMPRSFRFGRQCHDLALEVIQHALETGGRRVGGA